MPEPLSDDYLAGVDARARLHSIPADTQTTRRLVAEVRRLQDVVMMTEDQRDDRYTHGELRELRDRFPAP